MREERGSWLLENDLMGKRVFFKTVCIDSAIVDDDLWFVSVFDIIECTDSIIIFGFDGQLL